MQREGIRPSVGEEEAKTFIGRDESHNSKTIDEDEFEN